MANTLTLLKDFCTFYFVERDSKKSLSLLTNDIIWFGTSDFEDVMSLQDAENYFRAEMKAMPRPYQMKILGENYRPTGPFTGVAFLRMALEADNVSESVRITAASRLDEGVEKLCSMHFSVSDSSQLQDEFFPVTKQKQALARAKTELVMSTIEGGLLGGYVQNGFPFYFVSQRMLDYLGYADEKEFVDDIDGLIINGVHPDDRDSVSRKIIIQFSQGSQYAVDYRMKKKDGSYIWVHDIGRKTLNENDEEVIISVCYDVTDEHNKQSQLDEMIQSISCGIVVSKANAVDGSYQIQYMNKGFCQLFEGSEEELRQRYKSNIYEGVHPEDLGKVSEMAEQLMLNRSHTDGTLRFILPSGRTKWIRLDINAVTLPDGSATTYATYYDVTTQVQQEQQLNDVVHNVPGGICLYRWDGSKLHPIVVSEQFSAILGEDAKTSLEQTSGTMYKHVHPDDLQALQQAMLKSFQQNQKFEHTYRSFNVKTSQYRWIYAQGTVVPQADGSQFAYVCYTDITDEHLMGQKLLASERALDTATEHAGLWYWKYDPVNGTAYFNTRCMRDFNLPETLENYPQAWFDRNFLLPEYVTVYADAVSKIQQGEPQVVFEAQVRFKDCSIHWAEFRFTNLMSEGGNASIAVCTAHLIDVEKELLAKYEFERQKPSLGEKDLLIHATFNLDTGETLDYNYTSRLGKPEQLYKTIGESISTIAESIIDPDAKEKFVHLNDVEYLKTQIQLSNVDFSMDYRRRMPDKQIIWVRNIFHLVREPSTGAILLFEYCYDIHEQKMAEEVLYSVTTYDYEQIASVNFNIGTMMYYGSSNQSFEERMANYHTLRQNYAQQIVLPEEQQRFLENTEPQTVRERAAVSGYFDFTTKVMRSGNVPGIIKTRFVPYDIDNDIYIMTKTDVTSLLMEEETKNCRLREALDIARQANSAKTDFLSAMSHDIRTPMNAIVGMCELALDDEHNQDQVHESLTTIQSSSRLLLSLINNILDMSRIESGKMVMMNEPFSLSQQVNETIQSYTALATQKNQQFKSYVSIVHDTCYGDVARIHSAVDNVLANAIKYTPAGGTIVYRVSEKHSDKQGIGLFRFEISDTGIGISPEKQPRLFEPFYRGETDLTAKVEGTGLGLSITKAIVDLKGGTISVNSAVDEGTTFIIELPMQFASSDILPPKERGGESVKDYDLSGLHILLCEDHPINQMVIKKILEKANATVVVADDGKAGYDTFLRSAQGELDLILMDIQMPIMNGHEATKAIRQSSHPQAKTIPIIALSANAFSDDVQRSTLAGMNAHLPKPIVPVDLYEYVLRFTKSENQ